MYVYIYKDKSVNNIRNCRLLKFKVIMATEVTLRLIKLNKTKYEKTSNVYIFLPPIRVFYDLYITYILYYYMTVFLFYA